jgi:ribosome maturation factor RimP
MTISRSALREEVAPVVAAAGYDLEDVTVTAAGRRSIVRVVVDRDGGVDLDAVAAVSRSVSECLDASTALGEQPYVLEVTSPGVDRPLTEPRHWRRNVGRLITAGERSGRVMAADDEGVVLEVDGQRETVRYDELEPGLVTVEFSHPRTTS